MMLWLSLCSVLAKVYRAFIMLPSHSWTAVGELCFARFISFIFQQPTGLQVKLTEILGGAEGDDHHAMPEDVLLCGHLEIDLCAGDQTVLLDRRVDRLHPAIPEVYPVDGGMREETSGTHNDCVAEIFDNLLCVYTGF